MKCPSFDGFPVIYTNESAKRGANTADGAIVKWAKVVGWTEFKRDVPKWVASSHMWTRYSLRTNVSGRLHELRCRCRIGGNVEKYRKSGHKRVKHPFTRGFADSNVPFESCACELKIKFSPGNFIFSIELKLDDQGRMHSHPDLHPDTDFVCANLIKFDPSFTVLNTLTSMSKIPGSALKPSILGTVCNDRIMEYRVLIGLIFSRLSQLER
jgi:hypothetical protein